MTAALAIVLAPIVLAALVFLVVVAWRAADGILQGLVGGVVLTWRLLRGTVRAVLWAWMGLQRGMDAAFTWAGQRVQAAWLAYSFIWKRRYIAGALRHRRRHARRAAEAQP